MAAANISESGRWQNGQWVPNAAPATGIPGMPGLPTYPGIAGVTELFDPNFGRTEVLTRGAENAIAGGFGMGGFSQNQSTRLLDSERKANFLAGHQILEPYLQRDFEGSQNAANRQSRLNEIAAQGANALQQLQLSESGDDRRLTQAEEAQARRDILLGQQAMQQLTLKEGGDTSRQRSQIQGQLANTLLSGVLSGKGGAGGGTGTAISEGPIIGIPSNQNLFNSPRVDWGAAGRGGGGTSGLGSSSIDSILRKYNLI